MPLSDLSSPATPDEMLAFLAELAIPFEILRHEAAFTVEQSKLVTGAIAGAHTKNLFVKDKKGRMFLVVAEHERRIDLKRLHEAIGASGRLSFCSAEQMKEHLGVTPGSVTSLALVNDRQRAVTLVLDAGLMDEERINCHPLVNTMTVSLPRQKLLDVFALTGHEPLVVALPAPPAAEAEG